MNQAFRPEFSFTARQMLIRNLIVLGTLVAAFLTTFVKAEESVPPPKPPLLAPAPDPGDWTLLIKNPAEPAPESGAAPKADFRIVEVRSTVKDKLKRDVITYGTGKSDERWFLGDFLLWKGTNGEVIAHDMRDTGPGSVGGGFPSVATGFPSLEWLSMLNYDKVVTLDKRPCYHFVSKTMEAWIDVNTKLPVAAKYGDFLYQYTFNPAPSAPLVMPPEFQATWDLYQARLKKTEDFQKSLRNNQ